MKQTVRRFKVRGVFWRQASGWAVRNIPWFLEPPVFFFWSLVFYFAAIPAKRAILRNLPAILPGRARIFDRLRVLRIFWNFASTIADTSRFKERKVMVDFEFEGYEHFEKLVNHPGGAIILTAHMGSYDLGSYLFAERMKRPITIIRAPEPDEDTEKFEAESRQRGAAEEFRVDYSTKTTDLALELVSALQNGEIVAIQGDRVIPGIAGMPVRIFGVDSSLPAGPFALAMATHSPIFPLFVIRRGWRMYKVLTGPPIEVRRTSRDRNRDLQPAIATWSEFLEQVIREHWHQWYMFAPLEGERE